MPGEAALIVIGEPTVEKAIALAVTRTSREAQKAIKADAKEIDAELSAIATES